MVSFVVHGEFLTNAARKLWAEFSFKAALELLSCGVEGLTFNYQIDIIEGRKKLIGSNTLELVDDNFIADEYPMLADALSLTSLADECLQKHLDKERKSAQNIIEKWRGFDGVEGGTYNKETKWHDLIHKWVKIPTQIQNEYEDIIPYWMSVWLREMYGDKIRKNLEANGINRKSTSFAGLTSKTIAYSQFPKEVWENHFLYTKYCKDYHIYGDEVEEIWKAHQNTLIKITNPLEIDVDQKTDRLKIDYTMRAPYGWLNRGGEYYTCYYTQHRRVAKIICDRFKFGNLDNAEVVLENKGWVKIHTPDDERKGEILFSCYEDLTDDQKRKIKIYKKIHEIDN